MGLRCLECFSCLSSIWFPDNQTADQTAGDSAEFGYEIALFLPLILASDHGFIDSF